jgi:sulfoxide reductase heme-binding subunit YedZ
MSAYFTVWTFIRVSGFLGLYLMTFSLAFGLSGSLSVLKRKKALFLSLHQTSGWYGLLTILFHMLLIWQDQYVPYSFGELLLPFYAKNQPLFSAFGTLSFYLFFLVIGSSDFFIKKLGIKLWKKVHLAVIPAWILMLVHGLAIGTDTSESWALFLYASALLLIIVLGFIRYLESVMLSHPSGRPIPPNKNK